MNPAYVVVDDFRPDAEDVRAAALAMAYAPGPAGARTRTAYRGAGLLPAFEALLGRAVTGWDAPANGTFQWCRAEDPVVVHAEASRWAGVWFLAPDPPPAAAVRFHRSRATGGRRATPFPAQNARMFQGKHRDLTAWDEVDRVGNVFNRLVLWDGALAVSTGPHFGRDAQTGFLAQLFFFDTA